MSAVDVYKYLYTIILQVSVAWLNVCWFYALFPFTLTYYGVIKIVLRIKDGRYSIESHMFVWTWWMVPIINTQFGRNDDH